MLVPIGGPMGGRAGGRVPLCAPHMRGGSSILGPETPETPHWLCHRPTRLHTCSMAIPSGWESGWACTCTCTHIDATHATFISSRWSSHDPPQGLKKGPAKGTLKDHKDQKKGPAKGTLKGHKDSPPPKKKATLNPKTKKPFLQGDDL